MQIAGIIFIFWIIYSAIGLIFALKQKRQHDRSTKRRESRQKADIVDHKIYDCDYYLWDDPGSEEAYLSNLRNANKFSTSLSRCFSYAKPKQGERVLDIGCGRGELAYRCVISGCTVTAIDYSADAIKLANKAKEALPENLRDKMIVKEMDFKDLDTAEKYDIIFMADLIEHLSDVQLQELFAKARITLKKDTGKIIIHTSPNKVWINVIYPLKRILDWPSTLRKKSNFFYRRDKYKYDPEMHINEQTPSSLRRLLKGFNANVWCDDGSSNIISKLTKSFAGAEIWAIARLK